MCTQAGIRCRVEARHHPSSCAVAGAGHMYEVIPSDMTLVGMNWTQLKRLLYRPARPTLCYTRHAVAVHNRLFHHCSPVNINVKVLLLEIYLHSSIDKRLDSLAVLVDILGSFHFNHQNEVVARAYELRGNTFYKCFLKL